MPPKSNTSSGIMLILYRRKKKRTPRLPNKIERLNCRLVLYLLHYSVYCSKETSEMASFTMGAVCTRPATHRLSLFQSPEVPFSPRLTLRKRLVNHILGLSPRPQSVSSPADYLNCATPRLEAGGAKTLRPLSWGCVCSPALISVR